MKRKPHKKMFSEEEKEVYSEKNELNSKLHMRSLLMVGVAGLLATAITIVFSSQIQNQSLKYHVQILSKQLVATTNQYNQATDLTEKNKLLAKIKSIAKEREGSMVQLANKDPKLASVVSLPPAVSQDLPPQVKNDVEHPVNLSGDLVSVHYDDFKNHTNVPNQYFVKNKSGSTQIKFAGNPPDLEGTATINTTGVQVGNQVYVGFGSATVNGITSTNGSYGTTAPMLGTKKVAIVLMNFIDRSTSVSQTLLRQSIFTGSNSANAYYKEISGGKLQLTSINRTDGDIYTVSVPYYRSQCGSAAYSSAKSSVSGISNYDLVLYVFPAVDNYGDPCYYPSAAIGSSESSYPDSAVTVPSVVIHELGHDLGLNHANALANCKNSSGGYAGLGTGCTSIEYGDYNDVMGYGGEGSGGTKYFNAYHLGQAGLLSSSNTKDILASGTYTISPLETQTSGIKTLRIPLPNTPKISVACTVGGVISTCPTDYVDPAYYVEFRQPIGFDSSYGSTNPAVNGISVRLAHYYFFMGENVSDATQLVYPFTPTYGSAGNPFISTGRTYTDSANNVSITLNSFTSQGATVTVSLLNNYVPTIPPNPVAPPPPGGGDVTAPPVPTGLKVAAETLWDGTKCIRVTWDPSPAPDINGFTVYRDGRKMGGPSGGNTNIGMDDCVGLVSGTTYSYTIAAYDTSNNLSAQSAPVTINYNGGSSGSTDLTPPSPPTNLGVTESSPGVVYLAWGASTDNVGVTSYDIYRNNTKINTTSTINYYDRTTSPGTFYSYFIKALDAAGNTSSASNTATITTSTPPPPAGDTQAPSTPTGLVANAVSPTQVNLSWNASTDNVGVAGYHIYRNNSLLTDSTSTTFADSTAQASTNYTYAVAAFDAAGNVSQQATVTVSTPAPPPQNTGSSTLTGRVVLSSTTSNTPISGATIQIIKTDASVKLTTVTSITGTYQFSGITAGTYNVFVMKKTSTGYTTVRTYYNISVADSSVRTFNIYLTTY